MFPRLRGQPRNAQDNAVADAQRLAKKRRRWKVVVDFIYLSLPIIRIALFIVGYAWIFILPSPQMGRGIYIDENALQPGQVHTYWSWDDVRSADVYLGHLEELRDRNASSIEKSEFLRIEFAKQGLPSATQAYSFRTGATRLNGVNTYSILSAPRTSGTEAMVIAASWTSLNSELNLRGIATVLSLARYLKKYSLWAKDIVFVVSDGYLDGMQAWLDTYHGVSQSNLDTEPLVLHSGVIWTALAIDYPGHSFSHLGVFYEGLNGRLPNQDLMNSLNIISTQTGGVPVLLYDHIDEEAHSLIPNWILQFFKNEARVKEYVKRARNVTRHVKYQAFGRASGIHGLFHRFRIDAITLFAVPAMGPHGFHAIGRIVESTLRTMNNLLERLHASFFFYVLTGPGTFLKIGQYLPSAVIISVAMMFGGLRVWVDAGWVEQTASSPEKGDPATSRGTQSKWKTRQRNVLAPLSIILATHLAGGIIFWMVTHPTFISRPGPTTTYLPIIPLSLIIFSVFCAVLTPDAPNRNSSLSRQDQPAPLSALLKAFNLCLASTVISITSVLNFSLAMTLAVLLGVPLSISSPTLTLIPKMFKVMSYYLLISPLWWILLARPMSQAIWDWKILGVWFAPFVCLVYMPLILQAMIVCMLSE